MMTTDRYTRFVLTVIAICLVWICLRDAPPAQAQGSVVDVNIGEVAGKRLNCGVGCSGIGNLGVPIHVPD